MITYKHPCTIIYMIILLGFPKSGTSSFQKLFTDLGYKSYHYQHPKYGYI